MDKPPGPSFTIRRRDLQPDVVQESVRESIIPEPRKQAKWRLSLRAPWEFRPVRSGLEVGARMTHKHNSRSPDREASPVVMGTGILQPPLPEHPPPATSSTNRPHVLDDDYRPILSTFQPSPPNLSSTRASEPQIHESTTPMGGAAGPSLALNDTVKPLLGIFQGAQYVSVENFNVTVASAGVNVVLENPAVRYSIRKYGSGQDELNGAVWGASMFFFFDP